MIPCWCGLPSSFPGGPLPGKDEAEKNQLQGKLTRVEGKGQRHPCQDRFRTSSTRFSLPSPAPAGTFRKRNTSSFPTSCQNSLPFAPLPVRTRSPSPAHPFLQQHNLMQTTVHHHPYAASQQGAKQSNPSLPHASTPTHDHALTCL